MNNNSSIILIILIGTVIYLNSLGGEFVWDDIPLIVENPLIKDLPKIPAIFNPLGKNFYRPLRDFSHALEYPIWGLNPFGYHMDNLFLHLLNAVLLYQLVNLLLKRKDIALLTSLFFVSHPIATESVAYISGRRDILTCLFFLLSLFLYFKANYPKIRGTHYYYIASLLCYILSILAKQMGITLPLILILSDLCFQKWRIGKLLRRWPYYLPFLLIALVFSLVFLHINAGQGLSPSWKLYSRILTQAKITVHYIKLLLVPTGLCADYSFPPSTRLLEPSVLLSLGLLASILILMVRAYRSSKLIFFCLSWPFLTLLPVSNIIVPLWNPIAERYLYIPCISFCLLLALGIAGWIKSSGRWTLSVAVLVLLFYCMSTVKRNMDWKDNLTLWSKTVKQSPQCARAHHNLGYAYNERGWHDKAINEFKEAIGIDHREPIAYFNLGNVYQSQGRYDEAIRQYQRATEIDPYYKKAHYSLGLLYQRRGQYEKAIGEHGKAVEIDPNWAESHYELGLLFTRTKRYESAIREYRKAIEIRPDYAQAHNNLGTLYLVQGRIDEAVKEFKRALEINPDLLQAQKNLRQVRKLKKPE